MKKLITAFVIYIVCVLIVTFLFSLVNGFCNPSQWDIDYKISYILICFCCIMPAMGVLMKDEK